MAMVRLPTKQSGGRANLHQGAIGVGIQLANGITRRGVQGSRTISEHPDTKFSIDDLSIPHWDQMLEIACKSTEVYQLGYLGIDIVLDKNLGPMVLEVNVRPGLAIQLANKIGLRKRLQLIEKRREDLSSVEERIRFVKEELSQIT